MTEQAKCAIGVNIMKNGLALGEIYDLSFPDVTGNTIDTSSQNNPGGVMTKCVAWIETGNLAFSIRYTGSTAQNSLLTDIFDRDFDTWTIVMPADFHTTNVIGYSFSGQIAKAPVLVETDGTAHIDMEVTVNGKVTPTTTGATGLTSPFFTIADDDGNALTPSPAASATVYAYTVETYSNSASVKITPTATAGTIYVDGTSVATGAASGAITLNSGVGAVTMVSVAITELNKTPKIHWLRFKIGTTAQP